MIEDKRRDLVGRYPRVWSEMIADWQRSGRENAVWLMYSANYLLRTEGVRWAIDPFSLGWRIPEAPRMELAANLKDLSFVLLSHDHHDHLDLDLIRSLRDLPIIWVVPSFMVEKVQHETGLSAGKIILPEIMHSFTVEGISILPFEAQHLITYPDGTCKGVPEMGYLVECSGNRWLFPGDTRIYDITRFPKFGGVDVVFAHLWLGHGKALEEVPETSALFRRFFAGLQPKRILLTHLEELGRGANDFFDTGNAEQMIRAFAQESPHIDCSFHLLGDKINL
jgi:hypothetical protein